MLPPPLPSIANLATGLRAMINSLSEDIESFDMDVFHSCAYLVSTFAHINTIDDLRYPVASIGLFALKTLPSVQHLPILTDLFSICTPPQGSRLYVPIQCYVINLLVNFSLPLSTRSEAVTLLTNFLAAFSTSPGFADFAYPIHMHLSNVLTTININPDYNPNSFLADLERLADALLLNINLIKEREPAHFLDPVALVTWEETLRRQGDSPLEALASGSADVAMAGIRTLKKSKRKEQMRKKKEVLFLKKVEDAMPKARTVSAEDSGWK
ncbi:hypothetical protein GEMRC1_009268 [Eukaryota sp. GEM-RC1]